ncbi:exosome complex RNA-binding protein Csl4 [[Eubacterium] cellulosolvens]
MPIEEKDDMTTVPGDRIGVVEEFVPGQGTYEREGIIYSELVGQIYKDKLNKTITVKQTSHQPVIPHEGSTVIGVVTRYQERMASVDLFMIDDRPLHPPFGAILQISDTSGRFERAMNDVCVTGDIIKAKVISVKNRAPMLSTQGVEMGVIKAFCSQCGDPLELKSNILLCNTCNRRERRKIASTYEQGLKGSSR